MNIGANELSEIVEGEWIVQPRADWTFETVTISRQQCQFEKGKANLFIAIDEDSWHKGSGNIGIYAGWQDTHKTVHNFTEGLTGIIVQRKIKNINPSIPQLLVEDSYEAMRALAIAVREQMTGKIIAITGTAGKSSTKNMLDIVLQNKGNVVATRGNHNTRTGVPLTMACGVTDPDFMILETAISALWMTTGGKVQSPNHTLVLLLQLEAVKRKRHLKLQN